MVPGVSDDNVSPRIMGVLFSGAAGIMVSINPDELLPLGRVFVKGYDNLIGLMTEMFVMALSLFLLK
jgi:zinc transporter ZupT